MEHLPEVIGREARMEGVAERTRVHTSPSAPGSPKSACVVGNAGLPTMMADKLPHPTVTADKSPQSLPSPKSACVVGSAGFL